jgi:hypothetical protein
MAMMYPSTMDMASGCEWKRTASAYTAAIPAAISTARFRLVRARK